MDLVGHICAEGGLDTMKKTIEIFVRKVLIIFYNCIRYECSREIETFRGEGFENNLVNRGGVVLMPPNSQISATEQLKNKRGGAM